MEHKEKTENEPKKELNLPKEIKKITHDKIKGRIIIFSPENSKFAKNLKLDKAGDYVEKK